MGHPTEAMDMPQEHKGDAPRLTRSISLLYHLDPRRLLLSAQAHSNTTERELSTTSSAQVHES